ncbi:hypothetical protein CYMTET_35481, partial [Cymbomonas tetramitiformis]
VPDKVSTLHELVCALKRCEAACTLMANQSEVVKSTYCFRVSLIVHLFTSVVPMPIAHDHPKRDSACFYASQELKRETQADILRSVRMLSRHFAAAALSLRVSRSFDAARILTVGCMAAVSDAVMRTRVCDVPTAFCMHYAGDVEGPVQPYGFTLSGNFDIMSETMLFLDPNHAAVRNQVLEYFHRRGECLDEAHTVFQFEQSMAPCPGDCNLVDQLCVRLGFSRVEPGQQLTGERRELSDNFPEMGMLRDLVFLFKLMMVPTTNALPEVKRWQPMDAALNWSTNKEGNYVVKGFGKDLKVPQEKAKSGGFMSWVPNPFGGKEDTPRAALSKADPSTLVEEQVSTEDDLLYIEKLPSFGKRLSARDSELLCQYLTAPYIRIPLVLQFFANETRIHALESSDCQGDRHCVLFEARSLWQNRAGHLPNSCPRPREHLAGRAGSCSASWCTPGRVLGPLEKLLDTSGAHGHEEIHSQWIQRGEEGPVGSGWEAWLHGLEVTEAAYEMLALSRQRINELMGTKVFDLLENWRLKCQAAHELVDTCEIHAHLGYIHRYITEEELDTRSVATLLSCHIFLTHNCPNRLEASGVVVEKKKKKKKFSLYRKKAEEPKKKDDEAGDMQIATLDMFHLFQAHRSKLMRWLEANPNGCDLVMEMIIQL